jgi:hypothetical protein
MSHIVGTLQAQAPALIIGPDSGSPPTSGLNTWAVSFDPPAAPSGTRFLLLHLTDAVLPAGSRLEVDLGYGTDVFTVADGDDFWTRPVNIHALPGGVPIRYITGGAGNGGVHLAEYGRGERHAGDLDGSALSNCDPFLTGSPYQEPVYDPFWFCTPPPNWENAACAVPANDIRAVVSPSVGMILHVDAAEYGQGGVPVGTPVLSTCSVTLIGPDTVLTAGHCMSQPIEDAKSASVIFGYQTACDGTRPPGYAPKIFKVRDVTHQRYRQDTTAADYSIVRLHVPGGGIGLPAITMRTDLPAVGEQVFGLHHPNGAVKKLSTPHPGFATLLDAYPTGVGVALAVSGGSSGSGLFDAQGRITGILSNGGHCTTPSVPLSYYPTASILQDLQGAAPLQTEDVLVLIDRSGSMAALTASGRTKIEEAHDAASLFVSLVRTGTGNRVGLASFSTGAVVDYALANATPAVQDALVGPAPHTGGLVAGLAPGGSTSIGGGLQAAIGQLAPGANERAILLLTDGLQNTPPMVADVEGGLGLAIHLEAIGFGSEANLDGKLLTALSSAHRGIYARADSGLSLKKFFSFAFGRIFEAGTLVDPEFDLPAGQLAGAPLDVPVCGEEAITAIVGWDAPGTELTLEVTMPSGAILADGANGVQSDGGATWRYLRIELPQGSEQNGTWRVRALRRDDRKLEARAPAIRYFLHVVARGGPLLRQAAPGRRYYTGDSINPLVGLGDRDSGYPDNVRVHLRVNRPETGVGNILAEHGLGPSSVLDADSIPARQSTLMALEAAAGTPLVSYADTDYELSNAPADNGGRFEGSAFFGRELTDLFTTEGTYSFHYQATFGTTCTGRRELVWATAVDVGIDAGSTGVTVTVDGTGSGGRASGVLTVTPGDRFGNKIGPGRAGDLGVTGVPGTTVTGPLVDHGDGSYGVPATWDPAATGAPGVVLGQPGRDPVTVVGGDGNGPSGGSHCRSRGCCRHAGDWRLWGLGGLALLVLCCCRRRRRE